MYIYVYIYILMQFPRLKWCAVPLKALYLVTVNIRSKKRLLQKKKKEKKSMTPTSCWLGIHITNMDYISLMFWVLVKLFRPWHRGWRAILPKEACEYVSISSLSFKISAALTDLKSISWANQCPAVILNILTVIDNRSKPSANKSKNNREEQK